MSQPVTIIMIEDDEGHARLIERNIRRSGVNNEIVPFSNGTAAVNYLFGSDGTGLDQKGRALLILLDLNLPDMSGIDILRWVKENRYLKTAPVVVLKNPWDTGQEQLLLDSFVDSRVLLIRREVGSIEDSLGRAWSRLATSN